MGFLYKATSPSGKSYIGITSKSVPERWKQHAYAASRGRRGLLCSAIRKYGPEAFTLKVMAVG